MDINQIVEKALSRRTFLAGAGSIAAATALAGCADDGTVTVTAPTASYADTDILNFALNLEYLEASFYLYAAGQGGLAAADMAAGSVSPYQTVGTVTKGNSAAVAGTSTAQKEIIAEIAFEEQQHVRALRYLLGNYAVPMPNIDLSFFGPLAVAANIYTSTQPAFNPYDSFNDFLIGSFIFEDVGVTAYMGAAPLISAAGVTSGYLSDAAGILAVEAYHAAYIRTSIVASGSSALVTIANQVEALRAMLTVGASSGAPSVTNNTGNTGNPNTAASVEVPLSLPTSTSSLTSIVAADSADAVAFARNVNQVLHIVYGSPTVGIKSGGFFPSGMNSIFATTTA